MARPAFSLSDAGLDHGCVIETMRPVAGNQHRRGVLVRPLFMA